MTIITIKKTCSDFKTCDNEILSLHPTAKSIIHIPNNHRILFSNDYDKGSIKDLSIHSECQFKNIT